MPDMNISIGYMMVLRMDENGYLGGIMVTDAYAIPLEFKYSEPIKPTGLQKILYGSSIEKYLMVDVIAKKLIQNVQEKPKFILLDDSRLLGLQSKSPIIYIANSSKNEKEKESDELREGLNTEELEAGFKIVYTGTLTSEDMKWLERLSDEIDILEPFQRLKEALKYVCSEE